MDHNEASSLRVQLYSEGATIRSIAAGKIKENKDPTREDPDDPLVIFDIGDVIAKDNKWRKLLPSVEPFFALKCNHDPVMVKLMIELGRGFDCASKFAEVVGKSLEVNFPPNSGVRVIAEPGTFYIRSAGHLVTNIIAKRLYKTVKDDKDVDEKDEVESNLQMYYLNVGIFNAFLGFLFDREYFDLPVPLKEKNDSSLRLSCIWGPSCDSSDVLFNRCMMPEMDTGDFVIFTDCGGYTDVISSDFNGYCIPPTCYVAPSQMRPVLERIFANTNTIYADEFVNNNTPVIRHRSDSIDIAR